MNIYKNKNNGRLYKLAIVSPRMVLGEWMESEDYYTGERRNLNRSSWKEKDFVLVGIR